MFGRSLTSNERQLLMQLESFVKEKHACLEEHDYSHVLQVTEFAIEIASNIEEEVDPMVVICGALLHDIGRTMSDDMHGLIGGAMAEELLRSLPLTREEIDRITKVIVRHTPTSHVAPESVEEKIVYDADGLDRLGFELRVTTLGHVQRSGAPGAFAQMLASRLGAAATEHLAQGENGVLVGLLKGEITATPLAEVVANKKPLDMQLLELARVLAK